MPVRIGTAEEGGTFHAQGMALKVMLEAGIVDQVEIVATEGASIGNAQLLGAGQLDFGFMAANWVGRAHRGEPPFAEPIRLRVAAPMNAGPIFFITLAESPLYGIMELRGRRVAVGREGTGMAQHAQSILDAIGLGFEQIEPVYLDFAAGAEALVRGEVDAQLQCPLPNKVMTDLTRHSAIRPLFYRTNELYHVLERAPMYRGTVLAKGAIPGMQEDLPQVAVVNLLMTHLGADAKLVQDVARAVHLRADMLAATDPLFAGLAQLFEPLRRKGAAGLNFDGVPLHEAALQIYRASGLVGG
jgi:TRAP transporter TAXI family solute receptor